MIEKQKAPERSAFAILDSPGQRFPPDLIAQTEALQERRCLGILHRLVLCSGVGYGRHLRILLLPDPCSMISLGTDLCPCILHGPGPSVLFRGPDLRWGLLRHPCRSSLHGLCGLDPCPCLFRRRPSLELLEQGFSKRLTDLGLALLGRFNSRSALFNSRNALIGGFDSRSNFVACRRVRCRRRQILSAGD